MAPAWPKAAALPWATCIGPVRTHGVSAREDAGTARACTHPLCELVLAIDLARNGIAASGGAVLVGHCIVCHLAGSAYREARGQGCQHHAQSRDGGRRHQARRSSRAVKPRRRRERDKQPPARWGLSFPFGFAATIRTYCFLNVVARAHSVFSCKASYNAVPSQYIHQKLAAVSCLCSPT